MINRESDTEKELRGMHYLKEAGIELQIGIIPGLPGDSPEKFIDTVNTLIENDLGECIELYPLMILPGTSIRQMAVEQGILFQHKPPYYFQEGWGFSPDDIRFISDYVEDKTGLSHSVFFLPDFTEPDNPLFIKGVRFDGGFPENWDMQKISSITERSVIDIHVHCNNHERIYSGIERLVKENNPVRLINLIFYANSQLDETVLAEIMNNYTCDSIHSRLNVFHSKAESFPFRIFQVTESIGEFQKMDREYEIITPVYMITENSVNFTKILVNESPVLIKAGVYGSISSFIKKLYSSDPQYVAFQSETEMEKFLNDIEGEYTKLPFSFGLITV